MNCYPPEYRHKPTPPAEPVPFEEFAKANQRANHFEHLAKDRFKLLDNLVEALGIEGTHDLDRCDFLLCQAYKAAREHVRETEKGKV